MPDAAASARGKAVVNLINIPSDRKLAGVVPVREFAEGRYVVMVTRKGVIKKTSLADFQNIRTNGIIAINVDEGDQLLDVMLTDGTKRIFIATHNGLAIRFDEKNAADGTRDVACAASNCVRTIMLFRFARSQRKTRKGCCPFPSRVTASRLRSRLIACNRVVVRASST